MRDIEGGFAALELDLTRTLREGNAQARASIERDTRAVCQRDLARLAGSSGVERARGRGQHVLRGLVGSAASHHVDQRSSRNECYDQRKEQRSHARDGVSSLRTGAGEREQQGLHIPAVPETCRFQNCVAIVRVGQPFLEPLPLIVPHTPLQAREPFRALLLALAAEDGWGCVVHAPIQAGARDTDK